MKKIVNKAIYDFLLFLSNGPSYSLEIARKTGRDSSVVNQKISQSLNVDLIRNIEGKNNLIKLYELTDKGRIVLEELNKIWK